ncbi:hypothetical protein BD324DRAFT_656613 [Kockovaella imperatae]|uniref:Uncharacterized protein n=1 Tax=Kockovaella imperatae TaxID=4999 RepID=A0A1Y1UFL0_9TREE|nr:hypothetical protein BD324DRAFT_656613 [Kockovaella imperatae]ORX36779.1 hypothetical protein BD324DRAFT_656613 [Kockovaella imperatae]
MTQPLFFSGQPGLGSGSTLKPKRKYSGDEEEPELAQQQQQQTFSLPPFKRRNTVSDSYAVPELVPDHSNSASDDDIAMDQDQGMESLESPNEMDRDGCGIAMGRNYAYESGGSGGFGFGPGAEEDDVMEEASSGHSTNYPTVYPSLTPHPNPNHFSNLPPYTNSASFNTYTAPPENAVSFTVRPKSPLSAQAFSTTLAPPSRSAGLLQPTINAPLGPDATAIERVRAAHGPQCKSIPRLTVSPYPDPITGSQTMYSMCPDCGTIEKV